MRAIERREGARLGTAATSWSGGAPMKMEATGSGEGAHRRSSCSWTRGGSGDGQRRLWIGQRRKSREVVGENSNWVGDREVEARALVGGRWIWEDPDEDARDWRRRRDWMDGTD